MSNKYLEVVGSIRNKPSNVSRVETSTVYKWPIWIEGWQANEGRSPASFWGYFEGDTFADACEAFVNTRIIKKDRFNFNKEKLSFWGCRFFDTEEEASRSFG